MSHFKLLSFLLIVFAISTGVNGLFFGLLTQGLATLTQQACVLQANAVACTANSQISCGRVGASQQCVRFQNICSLRASNCIAGARYTPVNVNLCANIPLNTRGRCAAAAGTVVGGTATGGTALAGVIAGLVG